MAITSWGIYMLFSRTIPPVSFVWCSCHLLLWAKQTKSDWTTTWIHLLLPFNNQSVCYFENSLCEWMPIKQSINNYSSEWRINIIYEINQLSLKIHDLLQTYENGTFCWWWLLVWSNLHNGQTPQCRKERFEFTTVQVIAHATKRYSSTEHPRIPHIAINIHSYYLLKAWNLYSQVPYFLTMDCAMPSPPTLADIPDQLCNTFFMCYEQLKPSG